MKACCSCRRQTRLISSCTCLARFITFILAQVLSITKCLSLSGLTLTSSDLEFCVFKIKSVCPTKQVFIIYSQNLLKKALSKRLLLAPVRLGLEIRDFVKQYTKLRSVDSQFSTREIAVLIRVHNEIRRKCQRIKI